MQTVTQYAKATKQTRQAVLKKISEEKIPATRYGNQWMIDDKFLPSAVRPKKKKKVVKKVRKQLKFKF